MGGSPNTNVATSSGSRRSIAVNSDGYILTGPQQATTDSSGLTRFTDGDGDNTAQVLKASAGNLYKLNVYNPNNTVAYIQLFNTAAGSVTVGTTAPVASYAIPATGGIILDFDPPDPYTTAITYACTTTRAGSGDPTTGLEINALYK